VQDDRERPDGEAPHLQTLDDRAERGAVPRLRPHVEHVDRSGLGEPQAALGDRLRRVAHPSERVDRPHHDHAVAALGGGVELLPALGARARAAAGRVSGERGVVPRVVDQLVALARDAAGEFGVSLRPAPGDPEARPQAGVAQRVKDERREARVGAGVERERDGAARGRASSHHSTFAIAGRRDRGGRRGGDGVRRDCHGRDAHRDRRRTLVGAGVGRDERTSRRHRDAWTVEKIRGAAAGPTAEVGVCGECEGVLDGRRVGGARLSRSGVPPAAAAACEERERGWPDPLRASTAYESPGSRSASQRPA